MNTKNFLQTGFNNTEVVLPGIVDPSGLLIRNRILEKPALGQAIVKVEASGISFAEQSMMLDRYPGQPKFPFVPGYDLVGTVVSVGSDKDSPLIGTRVAALTKSGGWSSYALLAVEDLLPVPDDIDPAEAETLVVNGITAWQMLHRTAKVKSGQTILVHGANGGVGTILVQLAQNAGVKVIGTSSPKHHEALQKQGVEPIDYNDKNLAESVSKIAPDGVDAVFDNVGGESVSRSFGLLKPGGILVCYAIASAIRGKKPMLMLFVALLVKIVWLNIMLNKRKAAFYNIWSGKGSKKFRSQMNEDFAQVLKLLQKGILKAKIAAKFPLTKVVEAMELAQSKTAYGKVILIP